MSEQWILNNTQLKIMKKIFLLLLVFTIVFADKNYSQSLHKQKQATKTDRRRISNDSCQSTQSYTVFQSSSEVNKRAEFSTAPLFIYPIGDDVYRRILDRTLKGIEVPY